MTDITTINKIKEYLKTPINWLHDIVNAPNINPSILNKESNQKKVNVKLDVTYDEKQENESNVNVINYTIRNLTNFIPSAKLDVRAYLNTLICNYSDPNDAKCKRITDVVNKQTKTDEFKYDIINNQINGGGKSKKRNNKCKNNKNNKNMTKYKKRKPT